MQGLLCSRVVSKKKLLITKANGGALRYKTASSDVVLDLQCALPFRCCAGTISFHCAVRFTRLEDRIGSAQYAASTKRQLLQPDSANNRRHCAGVSSHNYAFHASVGTAPAD